MFFGALNRNLLVTKIETHQFFCYKQITDLFTIKTDKSFFAIKKIALDFLSIFESKVF